MRTARLLTGRGVVLSMAGEGEVLSSGKLLSTTGSDTMAYPLPTCET